MRTCRSVVAAMTARIAILRLDLVHGRRRVAVPGGMEAILGFQRRGDVLRIEPCVPADWPQLTSDYRFGAARYTIVVHQPGRLGDGAITEVTLDGRVLHGQDLPPEDDGATHQVVVRAGSV